MKHELARTLRRNQTKLERKLWHILRSRRFHTHKFRRQQPIGPYIADFVCFERRLVIELDGSQHVAQAPYDANRDAFLRSRGFNVLRFCNCDVFSHPESVVETIFEALHRPEWKGASTDHSFLVMHRGE